MRFWWPGIFLLVCCSVEGFGCYVDLIFLGGAPVTVEAAELRRWTADDFERNVGKRFVARAEGAAGRAVPHLFLDFATAAQTLFAVERFGPADRRLIERLYAIARRPRNVGANNAAEFERQLREWLDIVRRNGIALSEPEIRQRARNAGTAREIEAGVWLFKLKSGAAVAAFHTSRQENEIDTGIAARALNGLMSKVNRDDVVKIRYFHNHPATAPLSRGDEAWLEDLAQQLHDQSVRAPLQMFSLFERGGRRFAFGIEAGRVRALSESGNPP